MTIGGCEKRDCPAFDKCTAQYRGSRCAALRYSYGLDDPKTNYDRLRAKSVEEMAEFLTLIMMGEERSVPFIYSTVDKWLDWLRQEAKE